VVEGRVAGGARVRRPSGIGWGRVLEPACGEGVCVVGAWHALLGAGMGALLRALFGVEIDAYALRHARARLEALEPLRASALLKQQLQCGNAVLAPEGLEADMATRWRAMDWRAAFPCVFADEDTAGFDLIVGNPPYVREQSSRVLFDVIASTPWGARHRRARMDLWYFFVHRALELLRPGGVLCFIVNAYWTRSRGARHLIETLRRETLVEAIWDLGSHRVFPGVAGQHMIFRVRKCAPARRAAPTLIHRWPEQGALEGLLCGEGVEVFEQPSEALFDGTGGMNLRRPLKGVCRHLERVGTSLNEVATVHQGVVANPPVLRAGHRQWLGCVMRVGQGAVSYTHLRAHETVLDLVCRLLLEKKKTHRTTS